MPGAVAPQKRRVVVGIVRIVHRVAEIKGIRHNEHLVVLDFAINGRAVKRQADTPKITQPEAGDRVARVHDGRHRERDFLHVRSQEYVGEDLFVGVQSREVIRIQRVRFVEVTVPVEVDPGVDQSHGIRTGDPHRHQVSGNQRIEELDPVLVVVAVEVVARGGWVRLAVEFVVDIRRVGSQVEVADLVAGAADVGRAVEVHVDV